MLNGAEINGTAINDGSQGFLRVMLAADPITLGLAAYANPAQRIVHPEADFAFSLGMDAYPRLTVDASLLDPFELTLSAIGSSSGVQMLDDTVILPALISNLSANADEVIRPIMIAGALNPAIVTTGLTADAQISRTAGVASQHNPAHVSLTLFASGQIARRATIASPVNPATAEFSFRAEGYAVSFTRGRDVDPQNFWRRA